MLSFGVSHKQVCLIYIIKEQNGRHVISTSNFCKFIREKAMQSDVYLIRDRYHDLFLMLYLSN